MLYKTHYGEALQRILGRFGASEAGIVALEVLIQTVEANVKRKNTEELAKATCRGLHMDKPGAGVACVKCLDAAMRGATERALSGDELARGKVGPPAEIIPPDPREQEQIDRDQIAREVRGMLGEK